MNDSDQLPNHNRHRARPPRLLKRELLAILAYPVWGLFVLAQFAPGWPA